MWRTTTQADTYQIRQNISIHVPRVEDDGVTMFGVITSCDFNPRPPCGGRQVPGKENTVPKGDFNPRPPCGGRRLAWRSFLKIHGISIHVPRVEDDM